MINVTPTITPSESIDLVNLPADKTALEIQNLELFYGSKQALFDVNMKIPKGQVTALSARPVAVSQRCCAASTA